MTTKQAFSELISKRKWYADLGITQEAANVIAKRFRDGGPVSTDKIEELLEKAGYKTVVGRQWVHRPGYLLDSEPPADLNLVDRPDGYITDMLDWSYTVSHLLPEDISFVDQCKAYDIYLRKVRVQVADKQLTNQH